MEQSMARYFLHLRNSTDECLDPEGQDFPDLDSLRTAVLSCARDLVAGDIRNGIIDLRFRIDAENPHGETVYSLPFRHAVSIILDD
jgi:hypothetical protein